MGIHAIIQLITITHIFDVFIYSSYFWIKIGYSIID